MIHSKESQAAWPVLQPDKFGLDAVAQSDALLERAQEVEAEQTALLEASPLESQYSAAFAAQAEAKHDQAERIEDRLENLIEQHASRLQQKQTSQPSLFSFPGAHAKWQSQVQQQQSAMQRLHGRLEAVREIKDGIGARGPRVEELAHRKVRAQEPELAKEWEDMQQAARLHQALLRKHEQEK
jgi:hypothetical protein